MLKTFKYALGAALAAACHLAAADVAEVKISNLSFTQSGPQGWGWAWLPGLDQNGQWPTWVAQSAGAMTGLNAPTFNDTVSGWQGQTLHSSLTDGASRAQASVLGQTVDNLNGVSASAAVTAQGGQSGWAFAKVYDGLVLVGGNMSVTVGAQVSDIHVSGSMAQANANIQICSTDFTTDTCNPANYVEAFIDASSPTYSGPSFLTTTWTNPSSDNAWLRMTIGLTASADSFATPVPEPTSAALMLAGLAAIGFYRRRRV